MRRVFLTGIILLLPIVVFSVVLAKGFQMSQAIAKPLVSIFSTLNPEAWLVVDGTAAILMLGVCLLLGMLAQSRRIVDRFAAFDSFFVDYFPRYIILKSFVRDMPDGRNQVQFPQPVAIVTDDGIQFALEVERDDTRVVAYIPDAPSIWNGAVSIFPIGKVQRLDMIAKELAIITRNLGRGSLKKLPVDIFE